MLFATGWDVRWPDQKKYMNDRGGVKHFPGIHPDAAAYLAKDRKVAGLGIDTPSVDYGPSAKFETHNLTMPLNVFHIENAARLDVAPGHADSRWSSRRSSSPAAAAARRESSRCCPESFFLNSCQFVPS